MHNKSNSIGKFIGSFHVSQIVITFICRMDRGVGDLVATLKRRGFWENTILVRSQSMTWSPFQPITKGKRSRKKRGYFRQTDHKGEGGLAPSAPTVSKCENFDPLKRALNSDFGPKTPDSLHTPKKNHDKLIVRGRGSTLTISLTVKYPFLLRIPY